MSYDDTNRGALWGNRDKKSDKHPDFKGQISVDGKEYWLSAWKRSPDEQNPKAPALRVALTPKDAAHEKGMKQARRAATAGPDFDDDIPF